MTIQGLLGGVEIREIATRIGVNPTKKLGQNFVVDANTCRRIVKTAGVEKSDIALEIGPGLGSLTLAMMEAAAEVIAIEIDPRLAEELPLTAERHGFDIHRASRGEAVQRGPRRDGFHHGLDIVLQDGGEEYLDVGLGRLLGRLPQLAARRTSAAVESVATHRLQDLAPQFLPMEHL